jgi:catechol 2,3-dioxygenase-like lactoylglutathione lyase family enzyme
MRAQRAVPVLRVADVARSASWYRDILGFDVDPFPATPPYDFAILRHGTAELMLSCSGVPRPPTWEGWDVYLRLEEGLRELYAHLQVRGGVVRRLERMFYGLAEFDVRDPDGYVICLSEHLAAASDLPTPEA